MPKRFTVSCQQYSTKRRKRKFLLLLLRRYAACAVVGGTAATAAMPAAALAVEQGVIGDWTADGSKNVAVPDSAATNASGSDGTYREHNAAAFPANDATPIAPRAVPETWDYECDVCVVGAGGGGLKSAAKDIKDSMDYWGIARTHTVTQAVLVIHIDGQS